MKTGMILALFVVMVSQAVPAETKIKTGLWEVTAETVMEGIPVTMPAVTSKQCLNKEVTVPKTVQQDKNCQISQKEEDEQTLSWTVVCKNKRGELKGDGKVTFTGDTFSGTLQMNLSNKEGRLKMNSQLTGRYLGPCGKTGQAGEKT